MTDGGMAVGFQQLEAVDRNNLIIRDGKRIPRTFPIYVWYPAKAEGKPAKFGSFIETLEKTAKHLVDPTFASRILGLGGNEADAKTHIPKLAQLDTRSRFNAPKLPGNHPVILFPEYTAPASNSVLAEVLASHGFVVVSFPLINPDGTDTFPPPGLLQHTLDMDLVLSEVDRRGLGDTSRVGFMANAFYATSGLAYHVRTDRISAYCSLEGGITTGFEIEFLRSQPFFNEYRVTAPMLAITAPHEAVIPANLDRYRYSEQIRLHFPYMSEFYFLNYGAFDRHWKDSIGKMPGDTSAGLSLALTYISDFFKGTLQADKDAMARAKEPVETHLLQHSNRPAQPNQPSVQEVVDLVSKEGVAGLEALVQARSEDPRPLGEDRFVAAAIWLGAEDRDGDFAKRKQLALIRLKLYPDSTRAHFTMGQVANQRQEKELARQHLTRALELLPLDADGALTSNLRRTIQTTSMRILEELKQTS